MSCMPTWACRIFCRRIKYCIRCFLLVFCFFMDRTLSWCEIRQVLQMCTSSLLFRRAPPFLPRCCFLSSTFPSLYSSLVFYNALVFRSYLHVPCSLKVPYPTSYNPLLVYMLALRVLGMLRLFRVCFIKSHMDMLSLVTTSHDTLLLMLVGNN